MALNGTLVKQVTVKSDMDIFHELFRYKPDHICEMYPTFMKGVSLPDSECGSVGSIVVFNYFHDGKVKVAKKVIEVIDEEKKLVCYRLIEGDLAEEFKTFKFSAQVDTSGEENVVTWTFYYEKLNENVDDPITLMDCCINMTKDIDAHHLAKQNEI